MMQKFGVGVDKKENFYVNTVVLAKSFVSR